mgnify:FL=1
MIIYWSRSVISHSDESSTTWGDGSRSTQPLDEEVLADITDDSEAVGWILTATDGLTRLDGTDARTVDVAVVVVITDRRLRFLSPPSDSAESPPEAGRIDYAEIAATGVADGVLEIATVDGVEWRIPLAGVDDPTVDALERHLAWIGHVRSRAIAAKNDVDLAVGEIRESAAAMDWADGRETYNRARARLDDIVDLRHQTAPVPDHALAPALTALERRLESAAARLAIERATSRLTLARQLAASEDHERARRTLESARADYDAAREHALSVRRDDEFLFGEQRDVQDGLDRLEWELQAVAAEPLRQAHEATVLARSADDPEEAVEHWETAIRRYGDVLALCDGEGHRHFAGDPDAVADDLAEAVEQLVATRQILARTTWDEGVQCHREGDTIGAIQRFDAAVDHQARVTEVASTYRPGTTTELEARLAEMREKLEQVRRTGSADRSTATTSDDGGVADEQPDDPQAADDGPSGTGITASELAALDTHTEITFDDGPVVREGVTTDRHSPEEPQRDDTETVHGDIALRPDGDDGD